MTDYATAATFAAALGALLVGHQIGDYWVQTSAQAGTKGATGAPGRIACAAHVTTYTLTLAVVLTVAAVVLRLPLDPARVGIALAVSALSHYWADRRVTLERLADRLGLGGFYRHGDGLASGAAHLDQAWHWTWLGIAALIIAGH